MRLVPHAAILAVTAVLWLTIGPRTAASAPEDAEVHVTNRFGEPVEILRVETEGGPTSVGVLQDGEEMYLDTLVGRVWVVRVAGGAQGEIRRFTVRAAREAVTVVAPGQEPEAADQPPPRPTAATLVVVNRSSDAVGLALMSAPPPASVETTVAPGATVQTPTVVGAQWLLLRMPAGETIRRVTILEATQTETVDAPVPARPTPPPAAPHPTPVPRVPPGEFPPPQPRMEDPAPPPPPAPVPPTPGADGPDAVPTGPPDGSSRAPGPSESRTITVTASIEAIGVWAHVGGDTEMDTDGRDRVPVEVKSRLFHDDDGVYVHVYFSCREYGGDGTAYAGPRRTYDVATHANGRIEAGWRVVGIEPTGGPAAVFDTVSVGRQVGFQDLATRGTFWDQLTFRVDSLGRADDRAVGIRGTLTVRVRLER
jgi:hypothetical protein